MLGGLGLGPCQPGLTSEHHLGKVSTTAPLPLLPRQAAPAVPQHLAPLQPSHPQGPPSGFPKEGHSGSLGLPPTSTVCQNQQLPPTTTGTQGPLEWAPPH